MTIDYKTAAATVVPFGRYHGRTVDDIAKTDEGLLWLDWIGSEVEAKSKPAAIDAIRVYLADPFIAGELRKLVRP